MSDEKLYNLPSWNLSAFFSSLGDPAIEEIFRKENERADAFQERYRGNISSGVLAETLLCAIQEYESILMEAEKPVLYAYLLFATDSENVAHGAFLQKAKAEHMAIYQKVFFLELAILALPANELAAFAKHPALENYRHYLQRLEREKPHRLSEDEEKICNDLGLTGSDAFTRLFDEEIGGKVFTVTLDGETHQWPEEKILNLLYDANQEHRKAGADALTGGLREELRRFTFIHNVLGQDKQIRDRYRKFPAPESSQHLANDISQDLVDTMSAVVSEHYGIVRDFYILKREILGLETLYDYDRYAPVGETEKLYSFKEAEDMVLASFGTFSPVIQNAASEFFSKQWIDAETRHGKRGGAFCMFGTPDTHPVVFVNYLGKSKHVLTLAHELGHGVHASLMRGQTALNFNPPLVIAETASVFGEMLVFNHLKETVSGKEKLALYMGKIEEMFATVFRQQAMYKFEQDLHAARRNEGELSSERIGELWMRRQKEMFGDSVTLTDNYKIWWSYIPHFLHTPFYVYAYVFGQLLVLSFYDKYRKADDKQAFAEQYIALLSAGSSKSPQELVAPFGIDLHKKEFWQGGFTVLRELMADVTTLRNELS